MADNVRVDKWLWVIRVFKTRSQSTEACKKGRVFIGDLTAKPSREVHPGDVVKVKKPPYTRSFKVLDLADKRMSAKIAAGFFEDVTPPEEIEVQEIRNRMNWNLRERGAGRPTKKERRDLDDFFDL